MQNLPNKNDLIIKTIPSSYRPDGSIRKEIKIRPGFVTKESQDIYIPIHKRSDKNSFLLEKVSLQPNKEGEEEEVGKFL